jgi:hypothetical protein
MLWALAALVVGISLAITGLSHSSSHEVESLGGMSDEWAFLGANLAIYHTLGAGTEPFVFRPPGYPFFLAAVATAVLEVPSEHTATFALSYKQTMFVAHRLVLAVSSGLLFLWLSAAVRARTAFAGAVLFGSNPYSVVLTGFSHYSVVHWGILLAAAMVLQNALRAPRRDRLIGAGVLWGLAALVRPTALMMPPFVALAAFLRLRGVPALKATLLTLFGMSLAIAPWTGRNWQLTGRLIPVNAQAWTVLWATTAMEVGSPPDRYKWYPIAKEHFLPIYARVTGEPVYTYPTFVRNILPLEAAFREEALRNLRARPEVYLRNAWHSGLSYALDVNAIFLTVFERIQHTGGEVDPGWVTLGHPEALPLSASARAFNGLVWALTGLAAFGVVVAWRRRDLSLVEPVLAILCLGLGHALVYMDLLYYYSKLPFLIFLAFYGVEAIGSRRAALADALSFALLGTGLALSAWVM